MKTFKFPNKIVLATSAAIFTLLITAILSTANAQSSETRQVSGFRKIDVGGAYTVTLTQGKTESVTVSGDADILSQIVTVVESGTLKIKSKGEWNSKSAVRVDITFIEIDEVECSGSVNLTTTAPVKVNKFELGTSGAAKTELDITTGSLEVSISGSGSTTLKGTAGKVELDISGAGKYSASELASDSYEVNISGVGNAEVWVSGTLDVSVSGAGVVRYKGDPKVNQSISGSGKVARMN